MENILTESTPVQWQVIQTIGVIVVLAIIKIILRGITLKILKRFNFRPERKTVVSKAINIIIILVALVAITAIWSVDRKQLLLIFTSVMTIIGIAFFAQWSILSNITAGLILFFNHPLKIGSRVKILDKDTPVEGVIENISLFFLYVVTEDNQIVTIPNSLVLQKTISMSANDVKERFLLD